MRDSIQITLAGLILCATCLVCDQLIAQQTTSEVTEATQEESKPNKVRLAHISIKGELPESPGQMSLFGDLGIDLRKTITRLDKAAEDSKIAGIVLDIRNPVSRGKLNELTDAIGRVRASGKKVYAQMESAMGTQYQLAAACDEISMPESGVILIPGIHAEMGYYKNLLDKLGVEADILHMGEAKGAGEPFTRTKMSAAVKKNLTMMIDDFYDQMVTEIASNRNLKVEAVRELIDKGLVTARTAQAAGLIDHVAYPDAVRDRLATDYDADQLVYVMNYAKKKVDTDFSGPMGFMKLFNLMMGGSDGNKSKTDKIAIVYAVGPIVSGKSQDNPFSGQMMGSDTIVEALQEADEDERVQAIVLRVNSPGGSALASDLIWRATQVIEKPVVASMGDVAASGGYYISMGADKILAEPGTLTGSIGVVGGKFDMSGLYDKIGVTTDTISRGQNSGMFSTNSKFSDTERTAVRAMMQDIYDLFTTKAAAGRDMPLEDLKKLAGGKVYTGRDAKRLGLVDELGTLKDAVRTAKQLAGMEPDTEIDLKVLPEQENPFDAIFGIDQDAEQEVALSWGLKQLLPELGGHLRKAAQLKAVMQQPAATIMPFWIEIE